MPPKPLTRFSFMLPPRYGVLWTTVDFRTTIGDMACSFFGTELFPLSFERSSLFFITLMFLIVAILPNSPADFGVLKDCNFLGFRLFFLSFMILSFSSTYFWYFFHFFSDGLRFESENEPERLSGVFTRWCLLASSCSASRIFLNFAISSSFYLFSSSLSFSLSRIFFYLFW